MKMDELGYCLSPYLPHSQMQNVFVQSGMQAEKPTVHHLPNETVSK